MGAAHKTEDPPYGYDHTEDFLSGRSEGGRQFGKSKFDEFFIML